MSSAIFVKEMASTNHQKVTEWDHTLPADESSNNGTHDVETTRVEQSTSPGNQRDSEWDYTPATDGTSDLCAKVDLLEWEIKQVQKVLTSTSAERDAALAGKFAAEAKIEELKKVLKTAIRSHTNKTSTSENTHSSTYDLVQTLVNILRTPPRNTDIWSENPIVLGTQDQKTPPLGDWFDLTSHDQALLNNVPLPGNKSGQGLELFDEEMSQASPAETPIVIDEKDHKTPPPGAWVDITAHNEASPNIDLSSSEKTGQGFELFDQEALHEIRSEVTRRSSLKVSDSDTAMSQEKDVLQNNVYHQLIAGVTSKVKVTDGNPHGEHVKLREEISPSMKLWNEVYEQWLSEVNSEATAQGRSQGGPNTKIRELHNETPVIDGGNGIDSSPMDVQTARTGPMPTSMRRASAKRSLSPSKARWANASPFVPGASRRRFTKLRVEKVEASYDWRNWVECRPC